MQNVYVGRDQPFAGLDAPALAVLTYFADLEQHMHTFGRYFRKLPHAVSDTQFCQVREEIRANEHFWLADATRQQVAPPQRHTQTVFLRSFVPHPTQAWIDIQDAQDTEHAQYYPKAMEMVRSCADMIGGELGRVLCVRLQPKSVVYPHVDNGEYFAKRDRYHFVVESHAGSMLGSGNEKVLMQDKELWWFDNKAVHYSANVSSKGRTHLIFDLLRPDR